MVHWRAGRQSAAPDERPEALCADPESAASSGNDHDDAVGHRDLEAHNGDQGEQLNSRNVPRPASSAELNRRLAEARRILKTQPPSGAQPRPTTSPIETATPAPPIEAATSAGRPETVATASAAEPSAARRFRLSAVPLQVGVGILIAALFATAAVLIVSGKSTEEQRADRGPAPSAHLQPWRSSSVLDWLEENTARGASVLMPNALLHRGQIILQGRDVMGYNQVGASRPDLLVTRPGLGNLGEPLREAAVSAPVVASFGKPAWQVRDMTAGAAKESLARQAAGQELLENPALAFSDPAATALLAGELDSRLLVLLSGLATQANLVIDLPTEPHTSAAAPGRVIWIPSIDGEAVAISTVGRVTVNYFLTEQSGPLAASSGLVTAPSGEVVLAVRVPLPAPTNVLGGADMPTADGPSEAS